MPHYYYFFLLLPVFLLHCCSISVSCSVRLPPMGDGSGPDWQELWKIWQVPLSPPLSLCLSPSLCVVIDWREVTFKMKSRSVRKNVKAFMLSHGININYLSFSLSLSLFLPLSPFCPSPSSLFAYSPLLYPFPFSIVSLAQWLCSLSLSSLSLLSVYSWTA